MKKSDRNILVVSTGIAAGAGLIGIAAFASRKASATSGKITTLNYPHDVNAGQPFDVEYEVKGEGILVLVIKNRSTGEEIVNIHVEQTGGGIASGSVSLQINGAGQYRFEVVLIKVDGAVKVKVDKKEMIINAH